MVRVAKGRSACKRQPIAPDGATPAAIGAVRLIVGGLTLVIWVFARGSFRDCFSLPIRPTLVADGGVAAYQLFFFAGVARTGVAVGRLTWL